MKYTELKQKHEKELNNFKDMFFAFNDKQFNEGMESIGLTEKDTDKIYSLGGGGYILKEKSKDFNNMFENRHTELSEALKDKDFLLDALSYELANHEFCITYDYEPTFESLGITIEDIKKLDFGLEVLQKAKENALMVA